MTTVSNDTTTYAKRIQSTSTGYVCYLGTIEVGTANTYGQAERVCADAYEDMQHIDPDLLARLAKLTPTELERTGEQVLARIEGDAPAAPAVAPAATTAHPLRFPELPPVAISTLLDGTVVYGHFDNDDSQMLARAATPDGWQLCADEQGLDVYHTTYDFKFDGMTLDGLAALRTFLNSGVVEHLLTVGAAWGNNEAVPPKQYLSEAERLELFRHIDAYLASSAVQITRWVSPESGTEQGTDYTLGCAEIHVPDDGNEPLVWLNAADGQDGPQMCVESRWWSALADAAKLVQSETVQQLPAKTPRTSKRAA